MLSKAKHPANKIESSKLCIRKEILPFRLRSGLKARFSQNDMVNYRARRYAQRNNNFY